MKTNNKNGPGAPRPFLRETKMHDDVVIFVFTEDDKPKKILKTIHSPDLYPSEGESVVLSQHRYNVDRVMIDYDENKLYVYISPIREDRDD